MLLLAEINRILKCPASKYLRILGIPADADSSIGRPAYLRLAKVVHPDHNSKSRRANAAFQMLVDASNIFQLKYRGKERSALLAAVGAYNTAPHAKPTAGQKKRKITLARPVISLAILAVRVPTPPASRQLLRLQLLPRRTRIFFIGFSYMGTLNEISASCINPIATSSSNAAFISTPTSSQALATVPPITDPVSWARIATSLHTAHPVGIVQKRKLLCKSPFACLHREIPLH